MEQNNLNDIGFIGKHRFFLSLAGAFIVFKIIIGMLDVNHSGSMGMGILVIPAALIVFGISYVLLFKLLTFPGVSKAPTIEERKDWLLILLIPLLIILMFPTILPLL